LPTAYRDGDLEQMESEQRKTRARRGGNERGRATTKHARTFWTRFILLLLYEIQVGLYDKVCARCCG